MPARSTSRRSLTPCRPQLEVLEDRLCLSTLDPSLAATPPASTTQAQVSQVYGQLPLSFEANQGQADSQVNFLSHGADYSLALSPTQATLTLQQPTSSPQTTTSSTLTMQVVGGNTTAQPLGQNQQAGIVNYLIGNDPSQWLTSIPTYGQVKYQGVYSGIDLVYHGNDQQHLEYDFVVAPGSDPSVIRLSFQGAQGMTLDSQGNLVLHTSGGDVIEQAPVVYQDVNGTRQAVSGSYVLEKDGQVGFQIGSYDPTRPLVIDPTYSLVYSTYLGGTGNDLGYGIAVDSSGNAYVTGVTSTGTSPNNFPVTAGVVQSQYNTTKKKTTTSDAFVTKLNASGTGLVYSTFLGGNSDTSGFGIALDSSGDAYVTGRTTSSNFPIKNGFQTTFGGGLDGDAFIAKLNSTGSALLYSSYLGGSGNENAAGGGTLQAGGIAVDNAGNAYLTGLTYSSNFPTLNGLPATAGGAGPFFVTRVDTNQAGSASLVYSTLFGGSDRSANTYAAAIAIDGSGDAYITGSLGSSMVTTPGAFLAAGGGAFVAKLNTNLTGTSALVYSTYLNSNGNSYPTGIALDASGSAYITGWDLSGTFPTTPNAFQSTSAGEEDAFVTVVNPTGSGLLYSTYLGGSGNDVGRAIAIDAAGHVFVTGSSASTDFPTLNAFQSSFRGPIDAFVAELDPSQSGAASLVYSSYLGGSGNDVGYGIAVDSGDNAYVTGSTSSTSFPTLNPFQSSFAGGAYDAFVTKIDPPAPSGAGGTAALASSPGSTPSLPLGVATPDSPPSSHGLSPTSVPPSPLFLMSENIGWPLFLSEDLSSLSADAALLANAVFATDSSFLLLPAGMPALHRPQRV